MKPYRKLKCLAAGLAFAAAQSASAGVINFDTCITNCDNLGVSFGDSFTSVATLNFSDNSSGGVDFVFTNTVDQFDPSQDLAFLSELFLDFSSTPSGSSNESANIDEILIDLDSFALAGNLFDVKVDFANTGSRISDRILANGSASWTLNGLSEQDVVGESVVLMQRLRTDQGTGASRVLGSVEVNQQVQSVPEPAMFGLLAAGVFGSLFGRARRRRTTA